jgi:hypothetical protein
MLSCRLSNGMDINVTIGGCTSCITITVGRRQFNRPLLCPMFHELIFKKVEPPADIYLLTQIVGFRRYKKPTNFYSKIHKPKTYVQPKSKPLQGFLFLFLYLCYLTAKLSNQGVKFTKSICRR